MLDHPHDPAPGQGRRAGGGDHRGGDELIAIGEALGKAGHRVFSLASDMRDLDYEFAWMSEISIRAGVPVTYQVLQADFAAGSLA